MSVGFIGAGKVGCSFGRYLASCGVALSGYFSRNPEAAREAAEFTGSGFFRSMEELVRESDMIFLTVSDDAIAQVWEQMGSLQLAGKVVCHCSGVLSSEILSGAREARVFSVHPLLAVNSRLQSYREFSQALFTIEGEAASGSKPATLLASCGNRVVVIEAKDKVRYHAAAVLGSNLILGLAECAMEELQQCGFARDEAREALAPFMLANLAHLKEHRIEDCLTGPVERGDVRTVQKHMDVLEGTNREAYRLLSEKALVLARARNPERDYGELEKQLK